MVNESLLTELPPNPCVAWRQTGQCSPHGAREPAKDLPCNVPVLSKRSGYCEVRPTPGLAPHRLRAAGLSQLTSLWACVVCSSFSRLTTCERGAIRVDWSLRRAAAGCWRRAQCAKGEKTALFHCKHQVVFTCLEQCFGLYERRLHSADKLLALKLSGRAHAAAAAADPNRPQTSAAVLAARDTGTTTTTNSSPPRELPDQWLELEEAELESPVLSEPENEPHAARMLYDKEHAPTLTDLLVYIHIPKCAGSSFLGRMHDVATERYNLKWFPNTRGHSLDGSRNSFQLPGCHRPGAMHCGCERLPNPRHCREIDATVSLDEFGERSRSPLAAAERDDCM